MDFITDHKIPLGNWMATFVDWLTYNAAGFFDSLSYTLESLIMLLVDLFKWFPPAVPILMTALLAWFLHRSFSLVIFVVAALLLIMNLGYWEEMLETFVLVLTATMISVLVGGACRYSGGTQALVVYHHAPDP